MKLDKELKIKLAEVYTEATKLAWANKQVVGEKNDYYITLSQFEELLIAKSKETT